MTGILFNQNVLGAKRVELLREIAPNVSRIALLMNPTNHAHGDKFSRKRR